jgi:SAM-dependent methyltransferase
MARKSRARRPPGPADERTEKFQDWLAEQLDHKSWPSAAAFEAAKRELEAKNLGTLGCSRRTLEEHRRRSARSIKVNQVWFAALAWQEDPDAVVRALGFPASTRKDEEALLFDRKAVFDEQTGLSKDDQVAIITCRRLLEREDPDVRRLVVENLHRGVVYCYYYPRLPADSDRINPAEQSYVGFKRSLEGTKFDVAPRVYGFGIDPRQFDYFSRLHTLVHYVRARPGTAWAEKMYNFIECAAGDPGEPRLERRWYKVVPDNIQDIKAQLAAARDTLADTSLGTRYPALNPQIHGLSEEYRRFFTQRDGSELYAAVRRTANHKRVCVNAICEKFLGKLRPRSLKDGDHVQYLDIGCGNGEITAAIAEQVRESFDGISVTAIDPSPVECDAAKKTLARLDAKVELYPFETAPLEDQRFHLITSVHSFYTVDEVYLRKIYDLLEPDGVACIWIGALERNAMTQMCERIDQKVRPDQRRNYAEDIESILENMGLSIPERMTVTPYPTQVDPLVRKGRLNDLGKAVASFFAMKPATRDVVRAATQAVLPFTAYKGQEVTGHEVNDHLITFWRRPGSD